MNWMYLFLAVVAGVAVSVQLGVNAQLRQVVGQPILAALISFLVGMLALLGYFLIVAKGTVPPIEMFRNIRWWKWTGGLLGAFFITSSIVAAPRIGAANWVCLVIAGQLLAALLLDHYGYIGFPLKPLTLYRLAGATLIILGVYLIQKN